MDISSHIFSSHSARLQSIIAHTPNADRMVSYICLYCGLQVLGMLWGFLVNVFASISLHISGYIMGRCVLEVVSAGQVHDAVECAVREQE